MEGFPMKAPLKVLVVDIGGTGVKILARLPMGCRMGGNANAFLGGFRLWEDA
jgi:polyphosphate glucokinase